MPEACRREGVTHSIYGTKVARRNATCGCLISRGLARAQLSARGGGQSSRRARRRRTVHVKTKKIRLQTTAAAAMLSTGRRQMMQQQEMKEAMRQQHIQ